MSDETDNDDRAKSPELRVVTGEETEVKTRIGKHRTFKDKVRAMYRLDPIDHKIIEIIQENPVASIREIAALLDLSKKSVELRLKKPGVRRRLEDMRSSVQQLIQRGQTLGIKRLMALMVSKDEWIALQACKAVLAPLLNVAKVDVTQNSKHIVYEVQIGPQGQVYQTAKELADPTQNPQGLPDTMEIAARLVEAEPE